MEILKNKGFFCTDFPVSIPAGCIISRYDYPEVVQLPDYYTWMVAQFLGIVTRKLHNLQETIPGNGSKKLFLGKTQWNHGSFPFALLDNFQVLLPGDCATSGLWYPEVAQYPDIVTWRLCNFRVTISGGCTISRYSNPEVEFCDQIMKISIFKQLLHL